MRTLAVLTTLGLAALAQISTAAPDLQVTSVRTCNSAGSLYSPILGDAAYYVRVDWKVVGAGGKPYKVKFDIGDRTVTFDVNAKTAGTYWTCYGFNMPTDGPILAKVTLDPLKTSGDTTPANNVGTLTFIPKPPTTALEYYGARTLKGTASSTLSWTGNGMKTLKIYTGAPSAETSQSVSSASLPAGATNSISTPFSQPVYVNSYGSRPAGSQTVQRTFTVSAKAARTNRSLLEAVAWSKMTGFSTTIAAYLNAETTVQSTDAKVKSYVATVLPNNYKTTMTPAQAARTLYLALAQYLVFDANASYTAVDTLTKRRGDAGSMSRLYVATLRSIGIPARTVAGWRENASGATKAVTHTWTEFYLPNIGWVPQDIADCNAFAPTGEQAYFFGVMPTLNARCIVQRGSTVTVSGSTVYGVVNFSYIYTTNGPVTIKSATDTFSLKP